MTGILLGWMSAKYYPQGNDYWNMNRHAWEEYHLLTTDPAEFFKNITASHYSEKYGGFFSSVGSYWKDLSNNIIIKLIAICNLFTRGNYYTNSLFFNFLVFFGHVALYRVFADVYNKKWPVIAGCFLLPSVIYFTSGLHKDGVIFTLLGFFCYALYFGLKNRLSSKLLMTLIISGGIILLMRNYVFIALALATMGLFFSKPYKRPLNAFVLLYSSILLLVIVVTLLFPAKTPLKIISQKQKDFLDLPYAASELAKDTLHPTLKSFVSNTPQALQHGLLRPFLWDYPGKLLMLLGVELLFYEILLIWMLLVQKPFAFPHRFICFGIFFTLPLLLFIGYIVPNAGSIVRYRSLYLPFIMTPILCSLNHWCIGRKHIKNN